MSALQPDRDQIARFVNAMFRHADEGSYVNLRGFDHENRGYKPREWKSVQLNGARLGPLVDAAADLARLFANAPVPTVFSPPVATFRDGRGAGEDNLANGLVLSADCDQRPNASRTRLEALLGPATIVAASGGSWTDPDTGGAEDKVHLHWRLTKPTTDNEQHTKARIARRLMKMIIGSDGTAVPLSHPFRWPGSWHRKAEPRLARIVGGY